MQPPTDTLTELAEPEAAGANETLDSILHKTEEYARQDPMRAVGVSFLAGLVLNVLPIGALLSGVLRLALALVKPALVVLGAVKVYEEINARQK